MVFLLNHFHATNALKHHKTGDIIADRVSLNLERGRNVNYSLFRLLNFK
jgi:hypothetical protein